MAKKNKSQMIGAWAFLIGVILAVIIGLFSDYLRPNMQTAILISLILLGVIVGLVNIVNKEVSKFLLASLTLVLVSFIGQSILNIIPKVGSILNSLLVLFVPATIIVALKSLFELSRD